jgi:hypothetical protein
VTDEEKNVYYGQLIGLMGKGAKEQIRSKCIGMISLYHPDRVQHLGPELIEPVLNFFKIQRKMIF